jgi:two-component system, sporulation sensor kinase E
VVDVLANAMGTNPLAAINAVALAIGRFSSLDEMLDHALRKVLEVVQTEAGGLYLLDEERGELSLCVHIGLSERAWRDFDHLRLGEGLSGRVALTGEPIVVRTLKDDPRLTRMAARLEGFCAFASVPLRSNFKTYGTLNIYTREDRNFSEEEVQLLTSMASHIGLAVANTRLYLGLKASERKFRGLVENAEDAIYLTDLEGRLVYANPALGRLLGYDPDVLRDARSMLSLVHPVDRDRAAALFSEWIAGNAGQADRGTGATASGRGGHGIGARAVELRFLHSDGTRVLWFSQTAVPLRDEAGQPTGLQCIAQDITARREWQQQMMQAERLADLGRMAATIAHEIRNPLGAIINSINVLKRGEDAHSPESHLLDIVSEEAQRLNGIVSEVLMFAKPPARAAIACDVPELVHATLALFERGGKLRGGTSVRVQCAANLPAVLADPNQMRQVLWNLLANAAEAVNRHGGSPGATGNGAARAIDVDAFAAGDQRTVTIQVTDDGPGIADPGLVLEPFYTTRAQGTGLGLAIVARIVRDHGGTVNVENVPGRGARFSLALPVAVATDVIWSRAADSPAR